MPIVSVPSNEGNGYVEYTLTNATDETSPQPVIKGDSKLIHVTGFTGVVRIIQYAGENAVGVPLPFNGSTDFTADFCVSYVAAGSGSISVLFVTATTGPAIVTISGSKNL